MNKCHALSKNNQADVEKCRFMEKTLASFDQLLPTDCTAFAH